MAATAILFLTVYLLTWPLYTCKATRTCNKERVALKDRLTINYYKNMYYDTLKQRVQPKTVVDIQSFSITPTTSIMETIPSTVDNQAEHIKCGTIAVDNFQPVTNGHDAPEKRYPWQVYVRGTYSICGGVLISSQWVLTAAHCINKTVYILLGTNNVDKYSSQAVKSKVIKEIVHKRFNNAYNDIAMIKLSAEVQFNDYIRPACLPEYGANFVNVEECFLSGWGVTDYGVQKLSSLLQEVKVNIIDNRDCYIPWYFSSTVITSQHLCTALHSNVGACMGDSGGPLSCLVGPSFYVAGLASLGEVGCQRETLPDLYTRVSFYRDWIEKTMAEN